MTEKYDFKENDGKPTWFNHLLLQSDVKKLTAGGSFDRGIFVLCFGYTFCWLQGLNNNWIKQLRGM